MPYFNDNESDEALYPPQEDEQEEYDGYDDGFDDLEEITEPEESDEDRFERKRSRLRFAAGAGNLVAVIGGAIVILLLLTLLFNMIYFVSNDMSRNFTLFRTNF